MPTSALNFSDPGAVRSPGPNARLTRSCSGGLCSAGIVVRTFAGLNMPWIPLSRMRRSTRLWLTVQPCARSSAVIVSRAVHAVGGAVDRDDRINQMRLLPIASGGPVGGLVCPLVESAGGDARRLARPDDSGIVRPSPESTHMQRVIVGDSQYRRRPSIV